MSGVKADIAILKTDMSGVKADIATLKTDMSGVKADIIRLDKKVDALDKKVDWLNNKVDSHYHSFLIYTKQDSTIQESMNEAYIFQFLQKKFPSSQFEKKSQFDFYNIAGTQIITDIDGCILMNATPDKPMLVNSRLPGITLKNDSLMMKYDHLQRATIFIESKHTLNIPKIHTKLSQFITISNIIAQLPRITMATTGSGSKFQEMVRTHDMMKFPTSTFMIFASNQISPALRDLIVKINTGSLDETMYNSLVLRALVEDTFYTQLINDTRILEPKRAQLKSFVDSGNIQAIRNGCAAKDYGHRSKELSKYIPLYADIKTTVYDNVVNKLGVLYLDELIMPQFIPMGDMLIEHVGGRRFLRTFKKRRALF